MWISLFKKEPKEEKFPVMDGTIKVTQELKDLVSQSNLDDDLSVALWNKTAKSGLVYLSGKVSKKMEKKEYKGHPGQNYGSPSDTNLPVNKEGDLPF